MVHAARMLPCHGCNASGQFSHGALLEITIPIYLAGPNSDIHDNLPCFAAGLIGLHDGAVALVPLVHIPTGLLNNPTGLIFTFPNNLAVHGPSLFPLCLNQLPNHPSLLNPIPSVYHIPRPVSTAISVSLRGLIPLWLDHG